MKIIKFPNKHLFKPCRPVTVFGEELVVLLNSMWEVMIAAKGMGLASNQVELDYNMFVMLGPDDEKIFLVNPRVLRKSSVQANLKEGCLSAPGEILVVPTRVQWVEVEFQDEAGTLKKRVFQGIHAVCVQHEMEHLDGKIFMESKSIPKSVRKMLAVKWGFKLK